MEKYNIFDESRHEYNICVEQIASNSTLFTLSYSEDPAWATPGEEILSALDDGNGIKLSKKMSKKLDYSEYSEITVLFAFMQEYAIHKYRVKYRNHYRVTEEKTLFKV